MSQVETSQPRSAVLDVHRTNEPTPQLFHPALEPLLHSRTIRYQERVSCNCCAWPVYEILNDHDQLLYEINELDGCFMSQEAAVATDRHGTNVLHFQRKRHWDGCCFAPCKSIAVTDSGGELFGTVKHPQSWRGIFHVLDPKGSEIMRIANQQRSDSRGAQTFLISALNGEVIGRIVREGSRCCSYKLDFPDGLHLGAKATLLAVIKFIVMKMKGAPSSE
ncbi:uncharacterized protein LOC120424850 [Culex pipiens pallens]|uniref:uncharacterized protein LOC120424850 n=1 Tax=Culex pipiens pallens TaxID=42434 RepID=UPI001953BE5D|nr:uncharacterized protein LOC120424850 [Culex pipiens pallens]